MLKENQLQEYEKNEGVTFTEPHKETGNTIWTRGEMTKSGAEIFDAYWFSFDNKNWLRFYGDFPHELTPEQKKIFAKEFQELARLKGII